MDYSAVKNKSLKCNALIKLLSILALLSTSIYFLGVYSFDIYGTGYFTSVLKLSSVFLFFIYIFIFYKKMKAINLVPIIFSLIALNILINIISNITNYYYTNFVIRIIAFVFCVLTVISLLMGFNKKAFIVIAMVACIFVNARWLIGLCDLLNYDVGEWWIFNFTECIGETLLYVALLLFGLNNKIPAFLLLAPEKEKSRFKKMNSTQALKFLKEKFEFGLISEEEYQAQRTEIIGKL